MEGVYTIDSITGKIIATNEAIHCVVDYIHDSFVFGYTNTAVQNVKIYNKTTWVDVEIPQNKFNDHLIYHNGLGCWFLDFNVPIRELVFAKYSKASGYPYSFAKKYEAVENFDLFANKQWLVETQQFPIADYVKYTFGLEFETSIGIIPEELCFRDGLIPLRDGSISGNEYSTVVLEGNSGFNLLYQQLKTLREYTRFDKECSLHIHMGGFPAKPEKILSLYNLCYSIQNELKSVLPNYTFCTARYKASGKDYCKLLPRSFDDFDAYYRAFTGNKFYGDLQQAHPHDVERARKWQIHERYFWANLLNLICYRVNKTMEFRMLRPTYNLEKILFWIYMFNAIMKFAEEHIVTSKDKVKIQDILYDVYPEALAKELLIRFYKNELCSKDQYKYGDAIGSRIDIEDEFFDKDGII